MYKNFTKQRKWRFLMRVSFAYLFLLIGGIQLLSASNSRGQGLEDIMVTIEVNEGNLESLLKRIEHQTPLTFAYLPSDVQKYNQVTLKPGRQTVKFALDQALEHTALSYRSIENSVIIFPKQQNKKSTNSLKESDPNRSVGLMYHDRKNDRNTVKALDVLPSFSPIELYNKRLVLTITGIVTDVNGEPLIGVNILVKGTNKGTTTDLNGEFSLEDVDEQAVLVLSYIGYQSQEVAVGGQTRLTIIMQEDVQTLDEVVVVGYGTQKKVNLTGAVSEVGTKEIEGRALTNVAAALQGIVSGLQIRPSGNSGGEPGANMSINIRGVGSINGGSPYILVDGVPMELNQVSPADIQSVTVLKDAAASAIYGSRAPYGVILITTKQGRKNQKIRASYTNNIGWSSPTTLPQLANSLDFANSLNQAAANSGATPIFNKEQLDNIIKYQNDPDNFPGVQPNPVNPSIWGDYGYTNANTDWYDVYYKDHSLQQNHNLSVRGGTDKTAFYLGLDATTQEGAINFANDRYSRFNLTTNLSVDPTSWMTLSLKAKFMRAHNKYPVSVGSKNDLFARVSRAWPTEPVYTPNGDFYMQGVSVVPVLAKGGSDLRYDNRIIATPSVELRFSDAWKINADFTYNTLNYKRNFFENKVTGLKVDGVSIQDHPSNNFTAMTQVMSNNEYYSSNIYSSYAKQFSDHHIKILLGGQAELNENMYLSGWRRDLLNPEVHAIRAAVGDSDVSDSQGHWSTLGAFARFNYNYQEKYLLEVNGRYDGSSRFGAGKRWGFFPSVSVGYNIAKENFWSWPDAINDLKFRASYGSLGNQNVPNYLHYILIPISTNLGYIIDGERPMYAHAPGLGSVGLTWETSKTLNFGLDAGLFQNRLNLTLDVFERTTEDMVGPGESLPNLLGTRVPKQNNANLSTKGVELTAGWQQVIGEFNFDVTLSYFDNQSTILAYNNPTNILNTYYEGMELGEIWGYQTVGLFQSGSEAAEAPDQTELYSEWNAGDVQYADLNQDGLVTRGDNTFDNPGDRKVIGNSSPRHSFGLQLNAAYKGFDVGVFIQGVGKRDVLLTTNTFYGFAPNGVPHISLRDFALDYWTPENTDAYFARPYITSENAKNQVAQSRYLQDASYTRLKNLQIGYTLPLNFIQKLRMDRVRLYLSGENLFTMTNLVKGMDPEVTYGSGGNSSGRVYPLQKIWSVGLQATF